jgi:hypothetical protein
MQNPAIEMAAAIGVNNRQPDSLATNRNAPAVAALFN